MSALAAADSSGISTDSVEVNTLSQPSASVPETKEVTEDLQKKLEDSHISCVENVIIPNHLHVPEVEKLGFCFGSFDSSFSLGASTNNALEHDRSPPLSESSENIEEAASVQLPRSLSFCCSLPCPIDMQKFICSNFYYIYTYQPRMNKFY